MPGEAPTTRQIPPTPHHAACDCELRVTTGGDAEWFAQSAEYYVACPESAEYYADNDAAQSGTIGSGQETWMATTVVGPGRIQFRFKMSWVSGDGLAFYVDQGVVASWGQSDTWDPTGWFDIPSGTHTLKWKYVKYSGSTAGSAWIDAIQWTGGVPASGGGADWEQITYTYDPSGRRIAKDVDGVVTKYLYDGDHCIAEYDGDDTLLRKFVHGPSIDEPICMIEAAGSYAGTYYYHYDALGSVVALSDADGETVQVYEYDIYGQPAAADPGHPNPFAFTGRRFDPETGLYYYRARYYNPTLGRFLQTDPIGYGDGMNMYAYCGNGPVNAVDALGTAMLTQATGRLAISQGPETTSYLQGATMTVNWTHIKDIGSELLGQAAEVYGFVHDVGRDVAIHTIQELMGGVAGGIVGMARQAAGAATTVGGGWRAFIEVKDYNDINGNEEVDPDDWESRGYAQKDLWGKPYWVELKGVYPIGTPQNPTGGAGSHWGDVVGYDSAEAALGACHRAMALLAQPVLVSKAFGGYWDSGHASPLERVNWYISLQLSVADATTTFLENLVVVPGETK